jgi:hypothetical protein
VHDGGTFHPLDLSEGTLAAEWMDGVFDFRFLKSAFPGVSEQPDCRISGNDEGRA